jgi:hypothetical protein
MNKFIFIIILVTSFLYACTGDCIACHPVLKKSIDEPHHVILKSCINCHTKNVGPVNECGGDCFACHPKSKLINSNRVEHQEVSKCSQCHVDVKDLLTPKKKKFTNKNELTDILNQ